MRGGGHGGGGGGLPLISPLSHGPIVLESAADARCVCVCVRAYVCV